MSGDQFETLDITVISPDGKPLSVVITGDASQVGFIQDLLENAVEYAEWLRGERMGPCVNGWVN